MPTCFDSILNGQETDVDCGGPACPTCADGKACQQNTDCTANSCFANVCGQAAPNCMDGAKNGQETDVDCGGPTCLGCANGNACVQNRDCASGLCSAGVCSGGGGKAYTCNDAIACVNMCIDQMCVTACENMITTQRGKARLAAIFNCLEATCPSQNGGVCDQNDVNFDQNACNTCYTDAQMGNGACAGALLTCQKDM